MNNLAVLIDSCPQPRRLMFSHQRRRENMSPTWLKRAHNFAKNLHRIKNMLEDILSDVEVN